MSDLHIKSMFAGICFGIWPLLINRSGLPGGVAPVYFGAITVLMMLPFALHSGGVKIPEAVWSLVWIAALVGAMGMICFQKVLAEATRQDIGVLFILMIVTQTAVPALYQVYQTGLSTDKAIGFAAAAVAIYKLLR